MTVRTLSFVFIVSTNDVSSSRNWSSVRSFPTSEEPLSFAPTSEFIGNAIPSKVRSNSESELKNAFKSVLTNPSVTRRNVSSTSRSPKIISADILRPSFTAVTNSSPDSNPAESKRLYSPLIELPTAAAATFIIGLSFLFCFAGLVVGLLLSSLDDNDDDDDDDTNTRPPSPSTAEIFGTMTFDSLVKLPPLSLLSFCDKIPEPLTRLGSSSTNTPLGIVSRTNCPANAALLLEIWAVPSRYIIRPFFFQTDTVGSQTAFDVNADGISLEAKDGSAMVTVAAVVREPNHRRLPINPSTLTSLVLPRSPSFLVDIRKVTFLGEC
mmetsp:Transcript_12710/g.14427  ORF Transcript_12710/g.14427 Transcript_12710/m.14427 type:complete len:323 (+) Transcript_12710:293-1261(+)